ncbi:hypothetical protein SJS80_14145 [Aeromonas caviae]|uniref:hypothetical protein n=1 Tax=Aeromonas caviae TaxID=648 RepID=UPI0029D5571B|nr:hypothetical protein [Aeromonas caviae]MDX7763043.1 hypothetical protein [Aeromonas caviae]
MSILSSVLVTRVTHGYGVSRKSGAPLPYDFAQVEYLAPANNVNKPECNINSWGYEVRQLSLRNDAPTIKEMADCPKLVAIDLILEVDPQNPTRNVVVGYQASKKPL